MCVIRMDFFKFGDTFDKWLFNRYEFTSTSAYTSSYYTMGYTSRNVIQNIGPINCVFLAFFVLISLQLLFWPRQCRFFNCTKKCTMRIKRYQPQAFLIRFLLLFFLILAISALIPLTNSSTEEGFTFMETANQGGSDDDQTLEVYGYFVLVLLIFFMIVTLIFAVTRAHKLYRMAQNEEMSRQTAAFLKVLTGEKPQKNNLQNESQGNNIELQV